jgi:hypothetical protein
VALSIGSRGEGFTPVPQRSPGSSFSNLKSCSSSGKPGVFNFFEVAGLSQLTY